MRTLPTLGAIMRTDTTAPIPSPNDITSFFGDLLGAILVGTIEDQTKK